MVKLAHLVERFLVTEKVIGSKPIFYPNYSCPACSVKGYKNYTSVNGIHDGDSAKKVSERCCNNDYF
jgi:hypothetical protein